MKTISMNNTITHAEQIAAMKLFHAVVNSESVDSVDFSEALKYGILLVDNNGIVPKLDSKIFKLLVKTLGFKTVDWTQSFHKSWDKVATTSIEQLLAEQILNYFSTYGMEALGFQALNYVPVEKILVDLDAKPAIEAFTVVRVLTEDELKSEFVDFLQSVKAPHRDTITHIETLLPMVKDIDVDSIKSFEIKIMFCDMHNLVPVNGQDFIRFAIYKASNGAITTIVKDDKTIEMLKHFANTSIATRLFEVADLEKLSESFYRLKPLFLAFKANEDISPYINKIRRLAVKNHKPLTGYNVANLMNLLAQNRQSDALKVIEKADIRELVKLINFANYELNSPDHIYNIRNGKMFVKIEDENGSESSVRIENINWLLLTCKTAIRNRLANVYNGKTFYIPEGFKYVTPVSEKQMFDVLPYGSSVCIPEDATAFCVSGHWFNDKKYGFDDGRVDLDFHLTSAAGSYGWNSNYRSDSTDILYSGDMTNAPKPNGAVESFRISADVEEPYQLSINIFHASGEIPYELLFTKDCVNRHDFHGGNSTLLSAVVNPENALAPSLKLRVHENGEIVGYLYNKKFTIYGGGLGGKRRVPNKNLMLAALKASIARCEVMQDIKEFIELAGGTVVTTIPSDTNYIDLSMGNLTITTLFDVVDGKLDKLPETKVVIEESNK